MPTATLRLKEAGALRRTEPSGTRSAGDRSFTSYSSAASLANEIYNRWINDEAVTVGFAGNIIHSTPLVLNDMYTVTRVVRSAAGVVTGIELRNPWELTEVRIHPEIRAMDWSC